MMPITTGMTKYSAGGTDFFVPTEVKTHLDSPEFSPLRSGVMPRVSDKAPIDRRVIPGDFNPGGAELDIVAAFRKGDSNALVVRREPGSFDPTTTNEMLIVTEDGEVEMQFYSRPGGEATFTLDGTEVKAHYDVATDQLVYGPKFLGANDGQDQVELMLPVPADTSNLGN